MKGSHDVIVIGGGAGGAALAARLASSGADVLVLERTRTFRDRVRGDVMYPWGVAAAEALGVLGALLEGLARRLPYWRTTFSGVQPQPPRLLREEVGESPLAFFHPELQSALLGAAEAAGARVMRGARATDIERTPAGPRVSYVLDGRPRSAHARLAVGADGRGSAAARWAGFQRQQDPQRLAFAGVLLTGAEVEFTDAPADTNQLYLDPPNGLLAMTLPIDEDRTRLYAGYHLASGRMPEVGTELEAFLTLARRAGMPGRAVAKAVRAGPLAAFEGADNYVEKPYEDGVALIGDAAATSDPSFGSGMALTLLSAQLLAEALAGQGGFSEAAVEGAGEEYAEAMAAAYGSLRRQIDWLTDFYRTPGPEAEAWRQERYPLHAAEPWRVPDVVGSGPSGASDEAAKRAFLGEMPTWLHRVDG